MEVENHLGLGVLFPAVDTDDVLLDDGHLGVVHLPLVGQGVQGRVLVADGHRVADGAFSIDLGTHGVDQVWPKTVPSTHRHVVTTGHLVVRAAGRRWLVVVLVTVSRCR